VKFMQDKWKVEFPPDGVDVPAGGLVELVVGEAEPGKAAFFAVVSDVTGKEVARIPCTARLVDSRTIVRPGG
jgi:hypothetical protein